tara:strand:+ start:175 stop:429 length:255 start_codon:yes stop_codon:yes gene_type:complete
MLYGLKKSWLLRKPTDFFLCKIQKTQKVIRPIGLIHLVLEINKFLSVITGASRYAPDIEDCFEAGVWMASQSTSCLKFSIPFYR